MTRRPTKVEPGVEIRTRLESRRPEIEEAVLTRVYAISRLGSESDPEYAEGLRQAVSAAIDYGLTAIELADERMPPVPAALVVQARIAARNGIGLDTVLRRYFAGYSLLSDFLIEEVGREGLAQGSTLKRILRNQATLLDQLLVIVSAEHAREAGSRPISSERRRAERVRRLLNGELVETADLEYDLDGHHLGLVAAGPRGMDRIRTFREALDCRLLLIQPEPELSWAWLGGSARLDPDELAWLVAGGPVEGSVLAIGEPGDGLTGWRLTHRQARAALPIAQRGARPVIRYADAALLASILQDDVLTASLRTIFLEPLERKRDGGEIARETLGAYFSAERNISSAAFVLGLSRQAVAKRIRAIEDALGRTVGSCATELELALRLADLDRGVSSQPGPGAATPDRNHEKS